MAAAPALVRGLTALSQAKRVENTNADITMICAISPRSAALPSHFTASCTFTSQTRIRGSERCPNWRRFTRVGLAQSVHRIHGWSQSPRTQCALRQYITPFGSPFPKIYTHTNPIAQLQITRQHIPRVLLSTTSKNPTKDLTKTRLQPKHHKTLSSFRPRSQRCSPLPRFPRCHL